MCCCCQLQDDDSLILLFDVHKDDLYLEIFAPLMQKEQILGMSSSALPLVEQQLIDQLHATIQTLEEALERGEQARNALVRTLGTLNTSGMIALLQDSNDRHQILSRSTSVTNSHFDPSSSSSALQANHSDSLGLLGRHASSNWKLAYRVDDDVENVTVAAFKQLMSDNRSYKIEIEQMQRAARRWQSDVEQKERLWQKRLTEANESAQAFQQKCRSLEVELRALQTAKGKGLR